MEASGNKESAGRERPPVVEVACGVQFAALTGLLAPHLGLVWEKFRTEFPQVEETSPLAPIVEVFDGPPTPPQLRFVPVPPLPRVWMVSVGGQQIVQFQRDRFLYNWKRVDSTDEYPHYRNVIDRFWAHVATFASVIAGLALAPLVAHQYELVYVDMVRQADGWSSLDELGGIFPDLRWRSDHGRFLRNMENLALACSFVLPARDARMHIELKSAMDPVSGERVIYVETTVRGMPSDRSAPAVQKWFDTAHEWIRASFVDITNQEVRRQVWRLRDDNAG